jgi:hypothetical protein
VQRDFGHDDLLSSYVGIYPISDVICQASIRRGAGLARHIVRHIVRQLRQPTLVSDERADQRHLRFDVEPVSIAIAALEASNLRDRPIGRPDADASDADEEAGDATEAND